MGTLETARVALAAAVLLHGCLGLRGGPMGRALAFVAEPRAEGPKAILGSRTGAAGCEPSSSEDGEPPRVLAALRGFAPGDASVAAAAVARVDVAEPARGPLTSGPPLGAALGRLLEDRPPRALVPVAGASRGVRNAPRGAPKPRAIEPLAVEPAVCARSPEGDVVCWTADGVVLRARVQPGFAAGVAIGRDAEGGAALARDAAQLAGGILSGSPVSTSVLRPESTGFQPDLVPR